MKTSQLDVITSKLRKEFGLTLPDVNLAGVVNKLPLDSPRLNYIFSGGYPMGRMTEMHGLESSGKTVLYNYIGGHFQRRTDGGPNKVIFVDMEYSFDKKYANTVGLDTNDNFIFVQPLDGEEGFQIVQEYAKSGEIGLVIWDSVTSTPSRAAMLDEFNKANFGSTAALFSSGLRKLNPYVSRFKTSFGMVRQLRQKMGFVGHGYSDTASGGGMAPQFYASWRARVARGEDIIDNKEPIGNVIKVKNIKNKVGFPKRSAELNLLYGSGFNPDEEYLDFIIDLGIVKKSGAWFSNEDWKFKCQGRDNLLDYLLDNKPLFEDIKTTIQASFTKHTVLDEKEAELSEDDAEENEGDPDLGGGDE